MVVWVDVPGHGTVAKFGNEDDLMQYDATMVQTGQPTFAMGAKFGIGQHPRTAVAENGTALLNSTISVSNLSAPVSQYGAPFEKPVVYERSFKSPAPYVANKPVVYERTFGAPVYFGVVDPVVTPIIVGTIQIATLVKLIVAVILTIAILIGIFFILSKVCELKNPKSRTYTDANGDSHTTYTSGGGLFGDPTVVDINESTGETKTLMGGMSLMNIGLGALGIVVACGVGYVVYKKVSADAKKKDTKVVSEKKEA